MLKDVLKIGGGFVAGCVVWRTILASSLASKINKGDVVYEDDKIKVKRAEDFKDGTKNNLAWITYKQ